MNTGSVVVVAVVSAWFAILVTRQWVRKRRLSFLFWMMSLILATFATVGYGLCIIVRPHPLWAFYVYYACGALWMPSIMGLGSLALVTSKRSVWIAFAIIAFVGCMATGFMLHAPVSQSQLAQLVNQAGTSVISPTPLWLVPLICLNTFGAVCVCGVALLSVWKRYKQSVSGRFVTGNWVLAAGIIVISAAGSAARLGIPGGFWLTMGVGWVITFVGYSLLTPLV